MADLQKTSRQFQTILDRCSSLFEKKLKDYGPAWRILRLPSLTDQIFIKANRTRSIQNNTVQKIDESEEGEFIAIVNYSAIALVQIQEGVSDQVDMDTKVALELYKEALQSGKALMEDKNHDYGEAWRDMRISSLTDLILQKILRVKQIEDNLGVTQVSEGIDANYLDMLNYAVFALIHMEEERNPEF
ncbi:MAG: DUF1599 domain-containing protein [Flavobacteriales bacterium]|nr:DUF1599 domain-containing protein [Flavobacteriales bacterium]